MFLGAVLTRHARYRPHHLAVVFEGERLTYHAFNERVNRLANALHHERIGKGDKIATILPNCLELLELYWAAAKTGVVVVPLSPLLGAQSVAKLVQHSDSRMVFADHGYADAIDAALPRPFFATERLVTVGGRSGQVFRHYDELVANASPDEPPDADLSDPDPLMIVYSSGTTGDPKGIVLTHYVRSMYCALYASAWRMTPESVSLHTGSLVFNGAFMTLLPSFFLGGTYILHRRFSPEAVVQTIARERVTHMVAVPTQITALLESPALDARSFESMEALISLGETLHLRHKERLERLLPGRVYEMYGLAEGFMTILDRSDFAAKMASVGTPPPFFEMHILREDGHHATVREVGEIVGRGPILMQGYHDRPDLTAKAIVNGWLYSGDLGYVDEDGYLYLVDRRKDLIKSGGVSVYPRDIEEVILRHPAVREVAVFGVPDEKWGEVPVAAVVLAAGERADSEALIGWVNDNVGAKFQRVRDLVVHDGLPRNTAGKILKRDVRTRYLGVRATRVR